MDDKIEVSVITTTRIETITRLSKHSEGLMDVIKRKTSDAVKAKNSEEGNPKQKESE